MSKKVPNPNGKKGNKDHQNEIQRVFEEIREKGLEPDKETQIKLANGKKRFADVTGTNKDTDDFEEIHQIGRTNKDGTPVKRERNAMHDIEKATSIKVIFHPLTIVLIIIIFTVFACSLL